MASVPVRHTASGLLVPAPQAVYAVCGAVVPSAMLDAPSLPACDECARILAEMDRLTRAHAIITLVVHPVAGMFSPDIDVIVEVRVGAIFQRVLVVTVTGWPKVFAMLRLGLPTHTAVIRVWGGSAAGARP